MREPDRFRAAKSTPTKVPRADRRTYIEHLRPSDDDHCGVNGRYKTPIDGVRGLMRICGLRWPQTVELVFTIGPRARTLATELLIVHNAIMLIILAFSGLVNRMALWKIVLSYASPEKKSPTVPLKLRWICVPGLELFLRGNSACCPNHRRFRRSGYIGARDCLRSERDGAFRHQRDFFGVQCERLPARRRPFVRDRARAGLGTGFRGERNE